MNRHTTIAINAGTGGKMDRRRVLQALGASGAAALAAGAVPFATAAAQSARAIHTGAPGMSFPVLNVQHLSLQVADYVRSRDFYINVFGLRDAWDNGRQCALEFGSPALPNGLYIRRFGEGGTPAVGHIAFGVPNVTVHLEAMRLEMERRQLANIQADGELGWSADDPNGYELNTFVPAEPSHAMFPGAGRPCADAESQACHEAYEAGLGEALEAAPKPDGSAFKAYAFSYVVLHCADLVKGREFYENMMGMKVIQDHADQVLLRFGAETLALRPAGAGGEAYVNHYGFAIADYDHAAVKAELDGLGLDPAPHTDRSWTLMDPDGMRIEAAAWGFPEYLADTGVLL
jgi:catechol 2,3-dioxygenase-like lactoylglutathione lyase family enzyme